MNSTVKTLIWVAVIAVVGYFIYKAYMNSRPLALGSLGSGTTVNTGTSRPLDTVGLTNPIV